MHKGIFTIATKLIMQARRASPLKPRTWESVKSEYKTANSIPPTSAAATIADLTQGKLLGWCCRLSRQFNSSERENPPQWKTPATGTGIDYCERYQPSKCQKIHGKESESKIAPEFFDDSSASRVWQGQAMVSNGKPLTSYGFKQCAAYIVFNESTKNLLLIHDDGGCAHQDDCDESENTIKDFMTQPGLKKVLLIGGNKCQHTENLRIFDKIWTNVQVLDPLWVHSEPPGGTYYGTSPWRLVVRPNGEIVVHLEVRLIYLEFSNVFEQQHVHEGGGFVTEPNPSSTTTGSVVNQDTDCADALIAQTSKLSLRTTAAVQVETESVVSLLATSDPMTATDPRDHMAVQARGAQGEFHKVLSEALDRALLPDASLAQSIHVLSVLRGCVEKIPRLSSETVTKLKTLKDNGRLGTAQKWDVQSFIDKVTVTSREINDNAPHSTTNDEKNSAGHRVQLPVIASEASSPAFEETLRKALNGALTPDASLAASIHVLSVLRGCSENNPKLSSETVAKLRTLKDNGRLGTAQKWDVQSFLDKVIVVDM